MSYWVDERKWVNLAFILVGVFLLCIAVYLSAVVTVGTTFALYLMFRFAQQDFSVKRKVFK